MIKERCYAACPILSWEVLLVYCDDKQSTSNISSYKVRQTWPLEGCISCITMGNLAFLSHSTPQKRMVSDDQVGWVQTGTPVWLPIDTSFYNNSWQLHPKNLRGATRIHGMPEEGRSARWMQRTGTVPPGILRRTDGSQWVSFFPGDMTRTATPNCLRRDDGF